MEELVPNSTDMPYCKRYHDHSASTDLWLMGVGVSTISVVGLVANTCNIIVFAHRRMRRQPINVFFISISAADIGVLVSSVLLFSLSAYGNFLQPSQSLKNAIVIVQRWSYPLALISQTFSVWLTLSVALFRYVAICMPLYGNRLCRYSNAQRVVLMMLVFSVLYNLVRFFEFTIAVRHCKTNSSVVPLEMMVTPLRLQEDYTTVYVTILYNMLMFMFPFIFLTFVNCRAMMAVRRSFALRQTQLKNISGSLTQEDRRMLSRSQISTTVMLIGIVFVFLACNLPTFIANLIEIILGSSAAEMRSSEYMAFVDASNVLVAFNSSANIIIYISLSKQYRKLLLYIVFRRGPPPRGWIALGYLPVPAVPTANNNTTVVANRAQPFVNFTSGHKSDPGSLDNSDVCIGSA